MKCNVRDARSAKGLSLRQLSEKTGINRGRLSIIECGIYIPAESEAHKIAKVIGEPVHCWIDVPLREGK